MARLAGVCTGHKWPDWQPNSKQASAAFPQLYRVWPAYVMRHGPFLTRLVFSNEKACRHTTTFKHTYIHLCIHLHTCMYKHLHTRKHARLHMPTHLYTQLHAPTHKHTTTILHVPVLLL